jgi:hypothetical protein
VRLVSALEDRDVLGLVAEHVGRRGEPLEVAGGERPGRQRRMGVLPRPSLDGLPAAVHVIGSVHPLVR